MTSEEFNAAIRAAAEAALERESKLAAVYERAIVSAGRKMAALFEVGAVVAAGDWIPPAGREAFDTDAALAAAREQREAAAAAVEQTLLTRVAETAASFDPALFTVFSEDLLESLARHANESFDVAMREKVASTIRESFDKGLSVPDTAKAIRSNVIGASKAQALMLARTDLVALANGGSFMAARQVFSKQVVSKKWLTAQDARVRPTHSEASGQVVPMAAPFRVGGFEMQYPGDPFGPAQERIHCRCTFTVESVRQRTSTAPPMPPPFTGEKIAQTGLPHELEVFHGTIQRFATKIMREGEIRPDANGFTYVTSERSTAELYAGERAEDLGGRAVVLSGRASVKNPLVLPTDPMKLKIELARHGIDDVSRFLMQDDSVTALWARERDFDAVFWGEDGQTIALLKPKQQLTLFEEGKKPPPLRTAAQDVDPLAPPKGDTAMEIFGAERDTEALFTNRFGRYTEARRPLHQKIVAAMLRPGVSVPAGQQPRTMFLTGGSGVGKSTVRESMAGKPRRPVTVDPDAIKEQIPEYRRMVESFDTYSAWGVHEESSSLSKRLLIEANQRRKNVVVDGTGDSEPGKFLAKIKQQQAIGNKVDVVVVDAPVETAIARVNSRAVDTGRHISEATVRDIHQKVAARFPEYREETDWQLWANDGAKGSKPKLVGRRVNGVEAIYDEERFQAFLDKANG